MCKKICNNIIVYFAIVSLIFTAVPLSFAQEMAPETIPKAPKKLPAEPAEKKTTPGNVTIDFKDADILNVLRILSIKSGVNIVAGKDVEGTVTIRLVDVPWEKALDVVLKTYGFAYEREENIIRVATVENLGQEPLKTEVFSISYAKAEEVAESIKEIVSARGSVRADERSNTIIVTDIPTNIYKIEQVVTKLDESTPQVYIEARVIETTLADNEKLGIDWTVQATASGSKRPTTVPFRTWGSTKDMYPVPKYSAEIEKEAEFKEAAGGRTIVTSDFPFKHDLVNFPSDPFRFGSFPMVGADYFTFGTLDFSSFQAVLYMLDQRSDTKIISNPRTVTMDNQEAVIHVGEDYNIPTYERNESTGSMEITGYETKKIGITLTVTPHVNVQKEIVVDLSPEVSSFLRFDNYGNVQAPVFSTRNVTTQVMVKDGETIAIGGLLKEQTVKTRHKVPFLGDIPFLGHLFRYSADTIDTRDLLIFVTVKLVETKEDTEPYLKDITERMDKFEHAPEAIGHQWEPDTPIGSGKKKKESTQPIVE